MYHRKESIPLMEERGDINLYVDNENEKSSIFQCFYTQRFTVLEPTVPTIANNVLHKSIFSFRVNDAHAYR